MLSIGTRPEIIKLFPLIERFKCESSVNTQVLFTGQHREMAQDLISRFSIRPDYNLDLMTADQTLADVTAKVLYTSHKIIGDVRPDLVFVQGDTNSAFAVALAAFYQHSAIAHVEAGLRSGNIHSPWPEEANRRLIGTLANIHFAPTPEARANLVAEQVTEDRVFEVGNTSIDTVLQTKKMLETDTKIAEEVKAAISRILGSEWLVGALAQKKIVLVTNHRRENFGDAMKSVCRAIFRLASEREDVLVVFPIHPNPAVRAAVVPILENCPRIALIPPLGYFEFVFLMLNAHFLITDSGGIQEEAAALGIPALVTRRETERREGVVAGASFLVGPDESQVLRTAERLLDDRGFYRATAVPRDIYGDGQASTRILNHSLAWLRARDAAEKRA